MNKLVSKISIIDRKYIVDDRGWFLKILTGKVCNPLLRCIMPLYRIERMN